MSENDIKTVRAGQYVGEDMGDRAVFRGIKYATAGRFELPRICPMPSEATPATQFGQCCVQARAFIDEANLPDGSKKFYYNEFRKGVKFEYGEDCLCLNIYAPKDVKGAPVVLFVHGGSFVNGSADEKQFDGSAYARKGAVFVSVNYRLNVFGYFAAKGAPLNLGFRDVLAAIEWVRRNITEFGGDGENITLMGQSAGAMIVQTALSFGSPAGVRRGVMMSGGGDRKLLLPLKRPDYGFWRRVMKCAGAKGVPEFAALDARSAFEAYKRAAGMRAMFATAPVIDGDTVNAARHRPPEVECIFGTVKNDLLPPVLKHMKKSMAKRMTKRGVNAYVYEFAHSLPGNGGTFHSADLWYAIGSAGASDRPMGKRDFEIADEMTSRIVAFAKGMGPNAEGRAIWRPYRAAADELIIE